MSVRILEIVADSSYWACESSICDWYLRPNGLTILGLKCSYSISMNVSQAFIAATCLLDHFCKDLILFSAWYLMNLVCSLF